MNHARLLRDPSARPSSCELIPFLEFATSQIAGSHLSSPSGESSKIVPTLTLELPLARLALPEPPGRHVGVFASAAARAHRPSGQRSLATYSSPRPGRRSSGRPPKALSAACSLWVSLLPNARCVKYVIPYLIGSQGTEHGARLGRSRLFGLYAEAARPGGKLVEAVDESATGSVYSVPSIATTACAGRAVASVEPCGLFFPRLSTGACPSTERRSAGCSQTSVFGFRVTRPGTGKTTQTTQELPLNSRLLLFECLLNPLILEHLTARSQEVVREQQDRLGGGADFWVLVLG